MQNIAAFAKRPTTIIIAVLSAACVILLLLYLQKAGLVITKDTQLTQVHDQLTVVTASVTIQKDSVHKLTEELTTTSAALATATSSLSWYKKNWHKTTTKKTDSTAVTTIYKHDTTNTVQVHDSLVYRDHEVRVEYLKKGRIYAGLGGSADYASGKVGVAPEIKAGFMYGFTKFTYLGFEATKSGVLDYSQGYRVGAFVGGKFDF